MFFLSILYFIVYVTVLQHFTLTLYFGSFFWDCVLLILSLVATHRFRQLLKECALLILSLVATHRFRQLLEGCGFHIPLVRLPDFRQPFGVTQRIVTLTCGYLSFGVAFCEALVNCHPHIGPMVTG